uniref:Transposase n=1 Tax=Acrobeloides nanus TaxID=290746 RepID=A0A914C7T4_9BILA
MDNINRAKGNGIKNKLSKATAYLWYSKFRSNKMDIEDKKRSGRPREVDRVAVVNDVEAHPSMTTVFKKWLKSRWVPKELTEAQKRKRVEIAPRLLRRHRRSPIWSTRRTARTFPQATSTYSDSWNTGCEEKSSERSEKCTNLLLNSLILRTENGTAVGSTNAKNNGKVVESGGGYFDY